MTDHTPGPWRWELNRTSKSVHLCGGPPKKGFGRYDLNVLTFKRYGIQGAAPVFWNWDLERFVGDPHRADELALDVKGREHHSHWFADIDHPDARLIAAAPEMLDALVQAELAVAELCVGQDPANQCWFTLAEIRAAIAKATQR